MGTVEKLITSTYQTSRFPYTINHTSSSFIKSNPFFAFETFNNTTRTDPLYPHQNQTMFLKLTRLLYYTRC